MLLGGIVTFLLAGTPSPNLVPSMAFLTASAAFLPADAPAKPEHSFEDGWLVAGIAGGLATGLILGGRILANANCNASIRGPAPATAALILNLGLGAGLGSAAAATGSTGWKAGVVAYDLIGPSVAMFVHGFQCVDY